MVAAQASALADASTAPESLASNEHRAHIEPWKLAESGTSVPTGFNDLDRITGGLRRGSVSAIAGRSAMGKTALIENIALHVASVQGLSVAYLNASGERETLARLLGIASGVDVHELFIIERIWEREYRRFNEQKLAMMTMHNALISINDVARFAQACEARYERRLGVVLVDRPELLLIDGCTRTDREWLNRAMNRLKTMAQLLDVPVLVTASLSRAVEERDDHRPRITDLAPHATPVAQIADLVLLLYRDELYNFDSEAKNTVEVHVARSLVRTGTILLAFDSGCLRFADHAW